LSEDTLAEIERILGRRLDPRDRGSVDDLNRFPAKWIEAARGLPTLLRLVLLRYYTNSREHAILPVFNEQVVENRRPVETWLQGRILVPAFTPKRLVQMERDEVVAPLQPSANERWFRLKPRREYWDAREFLTGAPAVLRPDLNYRYSPPADVSDLTLRDDQTEPVADLTVAVRRWIASGLAGAAAAGGLLNTRDGEQLIRKCYPEASRISGDAIVASRALVRELDSLPEDEHTVPGFRGPDEWYSEK